MNVSGIRPYEGFYQYNSTRLNELKSQQIASSRQTKVSGEEEVLSPEKSYEQEPLHQNFSSYDFAQQYQKNETYELKGADSDIQQLDMEKAVSDLDKDQVLKQYQYFVGNQPQASLQEKSAVESAARTIENFTL